MGPNLATGARGIINNKVDAATQYEADINKRSVACQTLAERKPRKRSSALDLFCSSQTETIHKGCHLEDHTYSVGFYPYEPPVHENTHLSSSNAGDDTNVQSTQPLDCYQPDPDNYQSDSDSFMADSDDDSYEADSKDGYSSESDDEDPSTTDRKFIVFETQLDQLFRVCSECGSVCEIEKTEKGSAVKIRATCSQNHTFEWISQPLQNNIFIGDLLISAAILYTGGTFQGACHFAKALNLNFVRKSRFYDVQKRILFPVVNNAYLTQQQVLVHQLQQQLSSDLCGDARCDSPGYSAKYGTYSMMNKSSGEIVDFSLIQVSEVSSSNSMEYEGCRRCLNKLIGQNVKIRCLTTDRHTQVTAQMRKKYPSIVHQYDVWHLSKWVTKKLSKKAKKKSCAELAPWIQSVSNHLWWSIQTCGGNPEVLKEKWESIVNHVANVHQWRKGKHFRKCAHHKLSEREQKSIKFLKPGSPAHVALEEVVLNENLIKDLRMVTEFHHTGNLEVFHSSLLKYAPKREHFSYSGMVARTQLAILDHNHNTGRKHAVVKRGPNKGSLKYKVVFPKGRNRWVAKPILEDKSYSFVADLMAATTVFKADEATQTATQKVKLPKNIAKVERPPKEQVVQSHISRLNKKITKSS